MYRHITFALLTIVLGFFTKRTSSQKEADQTEANECRHVGIMASDSRKTSYSARCFIPTIRAFTNNISLFDLIPNDDEWSWVYNHNGSVTGQVLVRTNHSVYMISQKDCLDVGDARGPPIRSVYDHFDGYTPPSNVIGDFDFTRPSNGDAYIECVRSKAQWDSLLPWFRNKTLPEGMVQMVRNVIGGHTGAGQELHEFNFTYSKDELNEKFRQLVNDAVADKKVNGRERPSIVSGSPIITTTYPFETGLSMIGPRSLANPDQLVQHFYRDNSNLGWHRALQAKSALSNRRDPPPPMPNELKTGELVSLTVLTFVAIFLLERALKEAVRIRSAAIQDFDNPTGPLALLRKGGQLQGSLRASRAGTLDIVLALVTAIASMAAAILEFRESAYRYQKVLVVNSGGVITYGPSRPELSKQPENIWAGAEFSVNHWLALNITNVGHKYLEPLVYTVCALLTLYMFYVFYMYSLRREHDLDFELIRFIFRPVKQALTFAQNLLGKFLLKSVEDRNNPYDMALLSYESVFESVFNKLAARYKYQLLTPNEMPELRATASGFRRYNIDDFSPEVVPERSAHNPASSFVFGNGGTTVSRNEIAECAEILAADRFGMLGRAQALTLMYSRTVAKAADRFVNDNQLPDSNEIKQLALIYYVRNVAIPDGRGAPVIAVPDEAQPINADDQLGGVGEPTLNPSPLETPANPRPTYAVIGRRPRADGEPVTQIVDRQAQAGGNPVTVAVQDEGWHSDNVIYLTV